MSRDGDMARRQKMLDRAALPQSWITPNERGLHLPQGGVVRPAKMVEALAANTPIINARVTQLIRHQDAWEIRTDQSQYRADIVIVANSVGANLFKQCAGLPLGGAAGQIDVIAAPDELAPRPQIGQKYWAKLGDQLLIGATYLRVEAQHRAQISAAASRENIEHAIGDGLSPKARAADHISARASVRCVTPDQMPIIGAAPDWDYYGAQYDGLRSGKVWDYPAPQYQPGLYLFTGFGSRGLVTAPYGAAILTAQIFGGPLPADTGVCSALHPARFFVRAAKRTKKAL